MDEESFNLEKKLADLKHKHKMEQIKAEKESHVEVENLRFDNIMSHHRIRRADNQRDGKWRR